MMKRQSKSWIRPILIHSQAILNVFPINKGVNFQDLVTKILQPGEGAGEEELCKNRLQGCFLGLDGIKKGL